MGTPEFSVPTLQALIDSPHDVVACYTQPDKPKGRGNIVQKTPVKELCEKYNIPVYQPKRIKRAEEVAVFQSIEADVAVVIAYGQILPLSILTTPHYGCINIHASLLPKYRGAAPYQWAVIHGETKTGITVMQMDVGMDTGDMLLTQELLLDEKETAGSLHDKLMYLGGPLLLEALEKLEQHSLPPIKQDDTLSSHAPMLSKDFGRIDWTKSAIDIERLIRGLNPWPSSYTQIQGLTLKIYLADIIEYQSEVTVECGTIMEVYLKEGFIVKCGEGYLMIKEVQLEGKKRMDAPSFMRGYPIITGIKLV